MFGSSHRNASVRSRFGDVEDETRNRASLAWDALAGRPVHSSRWPMVRAGVAGLAVGWAAAYLYFQRRDEVNLALAQVGSGFKQAKDNLDERVAKAKATPGTPIEKAKAAAGVNANMHTPVELR